MYSGATELPFRGRILLKICSRAAVGLRATCCRPLIYVVNLSQLKLFYTDKTLVCLKPSQFGNNFGLDGKLEESRAGKHSVKNARKREKKRKQKLLAICFIKFYSLNEFCFEYFNL